MASKHVGTTEKNISILRKNSEEINKMLRNGDPLLSILKKFNLSYHCYRKHHLHVFHMPKTYVEIGNKKLEDFESEEEMLNKPNYIYENLSDGEREIYDKRKKDGSLGRYFTNHDGLHGRY